MNKAAKKFKRDLIPDVCEVPGCGYDFYVTRHRIKAGRVGGKYIPGNVIGLCPNHHVEAEHGKLTQFELFQIVQNRLKETIKSRENGFTDRIRITDIPRERITYVAYTPSGSNNERINL